MDTKRLIRSLQMLGTEATLLNVAEGLSTEQERRFWRAYHVYLARVLENTKLATKAEAGGNVLRRGRIVDLIERSMAYAMQDMVHPVYSCARCNSECGVVNLAVDSAFLKCLKCGNEFTVALK